MPERCRDCAVELTADNVWEPGTCLDCAKRLKLSDLHGTRCRCGAPTFGGQPICGRKQCGEVRHGS